MIRISVWMMFVHVAAVSVAPGQSQRPPHILYVVMDDVGWTDVSYHEGSDLHTPGIDALAASGVKLEQYYVQPVCSPTRSALMTGRYPFHTGLQHFQTIMPASKAGIPQTDPTLPELLRKQGYYTAMIGKWHLGMYQESNTPNGRGFDSYLGYMQGQVDYYTRTIANSYDFWHNRTALTKTNGTYTYHDYMAEAERIITGHDPSKPLFLYFSHQIVHIPLELPDDPKFQTACTHITDKKRHVYCAMMAQLDAAVSQTVDLFKAAKLWDDTVMVVTTDNGGMTDYQDNFPASAGVNFPLRAGKTTLFEGGVRGVAFVTGGDNVFPSKARGTQSNDLWHCTDIFATLLPLAGAPVPATADGVDMWPALSGDAKGTRHEVLINLLNDEPGKLPLYAAIRVDNWKLIIQSKLLTFYDGWWHVPPTPPEPAPKHLGEVYLFDLAKDPYERNDLSVSNTAKVKELEARLEFYAQTYVPTQQNIQACDPKDGIWYPCDAP